ncbi:MAG: nuclear transport factor 2 family protein [Acidobacteria bacterium]|nr:nuclear transport factor 2 family protein [Acidobacteriota bacterium]
MKCSSLTIFLTAAALGLSACGAPAGNTTANNSNSNAAASKPAAPTADALLAVDQQFEAAWRKGDTKFFAENLSDKFVDYSKGQRTGKAEALKELEGTKCDIKSSSATEPQLSRIDDNTYVLSYKSTGDGSCTRADGKSEKVPSPLLAVSVFVREGEKWKPVFHGEKLIMAAPATSEKEALPSVDKKDEPKKEEPKKEEPKKDEAKQANAPAANSNSTAEAPKPDANTEALAKIHSAGWEAFRNKDAKWFEANTTKDLAFADPAGVWHSGQASVIKLWTADMKCEGVTKTSFTDAFASALSPTVEILTGKGEADGSCDGNKNGPVYTTAFYVKEGEAWKLAFMYEAIPPA